MTTPNPPPTRSRMDEIKVIREVADRLQVSSPGERQLRGLLIQLVTAIVGDEYPMHHDLASSGALYPAPVVVVPPPLPAPRMMAQIVPGPIPPPIAVPAPAPAPVMRAQRPISIEDAARASRERAAAGAVNPFSSAPHAGNIIAPSAPAAGMRPPAQTVDGRPDPEGEQWLQSLEKDLVNESDPNTNQGA